MNTDLTYNYTRKVALFTGAATGIGQGLAMDGGITT